MGKAKAGSTLLDSATDHRRIPTASKNTNQWLRFAVIQGVDFIGSSSFDLLQALPEFEQAFDTCDDLE